MRVLWIILVALLGLLLVAALWLWTPDKKRTELQQTYFSAASELLEVGGTQLHLRDEGPKDAPVVVMIHGFGSSLHTWEGWAQGLSQSYRVISLDLPGSGLSPPDAQNDYRDQRVIGLLLQLLDAKGIETASLVGNSIGGRIAWRTAAAHPERVTSLVLVAPDGFASPGFAYGEAPKVSPLLSVMRYALPRFLLRSNLVSSYGDPELLSAETVDRYHDLMLAPGSRGALLERLRQTVLSDPVPALKTIEIPVLLIWGDKDKLIPVRNAEDYLDVLVDARLARFADLGHVPQEEAPERSLQPVSAFLAEVTGQDQYR
ncbi:MAG: alpha/beta fold hydrolase [Pseudomonadota bacterium]